MPYTPVGTVERWSRETINSDGKEEHDDDDGDDDDDDDDDEKWTTRANQSRPLPSPLPLLPSLFRCLTLTASLAISPQLTNHCGFIRGSTMSLDRLEQEYRQGSRVCSVCVCVSVSVTATAASTL